MSKQYFHPDLGIHCSAGKAFTIGGIHYPANWMEHASAGEIGILGFIPVVTVGARGDDRLYDNSEVLIGDTLTITATPITLSVLRTTAIDEVKRLRQSALDSFPRSSGVAEIYAENLAAAHAFDDGRGNEVIMRDGSTALAYLTRMASGISLIPAAFVAYVLAENLQSAIRAREIEAEYLRIAYTVLPSATFEQILPAVDAYQIYCAERAA